MEKVFRTIAVPASEIALDLGNAKCMNVVLFGAMCDSQMCIRDRAKDVGAMAAVLHFHVDAIAYTGGMAYEPVSYTHLDVYKRQALHCHNGTVH